MDQFMSLAEQKLNITPFEKDRVRWNADWEKIIEADANPLDMLRPVVQAITQGNKEELQPDLENHRQAFRSLCARQVALTTWAIECFAQKDFEERWLQGGQALQQEHILEGFGRTYGEDNGQGFLRLMKCFMLDDVSCIPSQPIYLPSTRWPLSPGNDRIRLSAAEEEYIIGHYNVCRNDFFCRFLFNTLQSFYGIPQKARTVTVKQSGHMPKSAKMVEDIVWGRDNAKNMRREYAAERKSHVILCENCRKAQNDSNDNSFKCCMACKQKMDRKIYYCSKNCQKEDWKPRHRLICGKPLTLHDAEATAVPLPDTHISSRRGPVPTERVGATVGGFKRSPALSFQINILQSNSVQKPDYVLIDSAGRYKAVTIQHPIEKSIFRDFRDKAFTTGDPKAVAAVGQFLVKDPGGPFQVVGVTRKAVLAQLKREFDLDVEAAVDRLDRARAVRGEGTEVEKTLIKLGL